jgi:hypothetical protein
MPRFTKEKLIYWSCTSWHTHSKAAELHHIPKQTASDIWLKFKKKLAQHMPSLTLDIHQRLQIVLSNLSFARPE